MTKTSKLTPFWEASLEIIQQNYPGVQFSYLEEVFTNSRLDLESFIKEVESGRPLDYIAQTRHFAGYDFFVDERVLIPRYETELLYEMSLEEISKHTASKIKMIEVGVGSGCLGLSIMASSSKEIDFTATDISSDAINVFQLNLDQIKKEFKLGHTIKIVQVDRLESINKEQFDLIISNPPYIKTLADKDSVHKTTYKHEPHLALFIDDLTYEQWFSEFFEQVWDCLVDGGCFMMEGHEEHLQSQADSLSRDNWSHVEVKQDLTRRNRFLVLRK